MSQPIPLSDREKHVLRMLVEHPQGELPMPQYGLSSQALRKCKLDICRKLLCKNISDALLKAKKMGLVPIFDVENLTQ